MLIQNVTGGEGLKSAEKVSRIIWMAPLYDSIVGGIDVK